LLVVCVTLYWTRQHTDGGIIDLQEQIRQQQQGGGNSPSPLNLNSNPGTEPVAAGGAEDPRLEQTKATLSRALVDLENSQSSVKRLSMELEAARAKLLQTQSEGGAGGGAFVPSDGSRPLATAHGPIEVPGYPPIAIAASKQFSKFFCIGGRGRLGAQNDRSCRFQNLCQCEPLTGASAVPGAQQMPLTVISAGCLSSLDSVCDALDLSAVVLRLQAQHESMAVLPRSR
jgi:hypothetical protein